MHPLARTQLTIRFKLLHLSKFSYLVDFEPLHWSSGNVMSIGNSNVLYSMLCSVLADTFDIGDVADGGSL